MRGSAPEGSGRGAALVEKRRGSAPEGSGRDVVQAPPLPEAQLPTRSVFST